MLVNTSTVSVMLQHQACSELPDMANSAAVLALIRSGMRSNLQREEIHCNQLECINRPTAEVAVGKQ